MASVGTTTWKLRNYDLIEVARDYASRSQMYCPSILDFGPGAAVKFLVNLLPKGKSEEWTKSQKIQRGILKASESVIRRTDLFELDIPEPLEIMKSFAGLQPRAFYVVDNNLRIIECLRNLIMPDYFTQNFDFQHCDIANEEIVFKGDVAFAYNILERISNPQRAVENIGKVLRPEGLLSTTYAVNSSGFEEVGRCLYRKV